MESVAEHTEIEQLLAHHRWLRELAVNLVRDGGHADDLVQETWEAALRRPPARGQSERAWLGTVLRNAGRMRWRGEARRSRRELESPAVPQRPASPAELLEKAQMQRVLVGCVLALPEPYRSTVLLRYVEELSCADIAREQGIPAGTVRRRLKEALDRLRVALDDQCGGQEGGWRPALAPLLPPAMASATAATTASGGFAMITSFKVAAALIAVSALAATGVVALSHSPAEPSTETASARSTAPASTGERATHGEALERPAAHRAASRADQLRRFRTRADREEVERAIARARRPAATGSSRPVATAASSAASEPNVEYIKARLDDARALVHECYSITLEEDPTIEGTLAVWLEIEAEPDIGGLVTLVEFLPDSTITHDGMRECVTEMLYSIELDQPLRTTTVATAVTMEFRTTPRD